MQKKAKVEIRKSENRKRKSAARTENDHEKEEDKPDAAENNRKRPVPPSRVVTPDGTEDISELQQTEKDKEPKSKKPKTKSDDVDPTPSKSRSSPHPDHVPIVFRGTKIKDYEWKIARRDSDLSSHIQQVREMIEKLNTLVDTRCEMIKIADCTRCYGAPAPDKCTINMLKSCIDRNLLDSDNMIKSIRDTVIRMSTLPERIPCTDVTSVDERASIHLFDHLVPRIFKRAAEQTLPVSKTMRAAGIDIVSVSIPLVNECGATMIIDIERDSKCEFDKAGNALLITSTLHTFDILIGVIYGDQPNVMYLNNARSNSSPWSTEMHTAFDSMADDPVEFFECASSIYGSCAVRGCKRCTKSNTPKLDPICRKMLMRSMTRPRCPDESAAADPVTDGEEADSDSSSSSSASSSDCDA